MQANTDLITQAWQLFRAQRWRQAAALVKQFSPVDVIHAVGTRYKKLSKDQLAGDRMIWEDFIEDSFNGKYD